MATTIDFLPFTITAPGDYILGSDLSTSDQGIIINADNVTVNLNGNTITSTSHDPNNQFCAVQSQSHTNITIQNGEITGFAYGVYLAISDTYSQFSNSLIQNLDITDCTYRGIKVEGTGNVVRNNEIAHIGGATFIPSAYAMGIET